MDEDRKLSTICLLAVSTRGTEEIMAEIVQRWTARESGPLDSLPFASTVMHVTGILRDRDFAPLRLYS